MTDNRAASSAPPPYYQSSGGEPPSEPPPKYEESKQHGVNNTNQPYPPQGYQNAPPIYNQPQAVTVIQMSFGPNPALITCPYCQSLVTTTLVYESGALTWLVSGLLCLFGCWLGCCLIPFCIPDLQDVEHRCPECYEIVGRFRRLS